MKNAVIKIVDSIVTTVDVVAIEEMIVTIEEVTFISSESQSHIS